MYLSFSVLVFLFYVFSFYLVMSVDDWIVVWLGLEINMICFMSFMYKQNNVFVVESCFKYFFVQGVASALFICMMFLGNENFMFFVFVTLMMSVGGGPFFFWMVSVFIGIDWFAGLVLMTVQKFLPFCVVSSFMVEMVWVFGLVSLLIGGVGALNQLTMKRLVIYSSIHHLGWMMIVLTLGWWIWLNYYLMYVIMMFLIVLGFMKEEVVSISDEVGVSKNWTFVFGVLNMSGVPPFLGFILKLFVFYNVISMDFLLTLFFVGMSVLMLYIYIRLVFSYIFEWKNMIGYWCELGEMLSVFDYVIYMVMGSFVGVLLLY